MNGLIGRSLPRSFGLTRSEEWGLAAGFALLLVILVATAANAVFGIGGKAATEPIRDWLSSAAYILVAGIVALRAIRAKEKRLSLALFAVGFVLYGLGNVLWSLWIEHLQNPPIPSLCDGLWLIFYPLSYAGIVGLARERGLRRLPAVVWLDAIIAGLGLAALGAALIFRPVLSSATGSSAAVATELAYPIGDLLLAGLVVGVLALRGWHIDRTWALLGGGFLLLAVADCMYAVQVAAGSSRPSAMTNLMYVFAVALLAFAAWQVECRGRDLRPASWWVWLVPAGFSLAALGLLLYDHVERLDPLTFGLAILTLLAAILRMALAFRDVRGLAEARWQATTDDLTALPNRRLFIRRAGDVIAAARLSNSRLSVLIVDLDNFKQLNDTLGHAAGDSLLCLIGPRLKRALRATDTVARLAGDDFAILLDPEPNEDGIVRVAEKVLRALCEPFEVRGLALRITASVGIASFPTHAQDADELLQRASIAMYHAKLARTGYAFYARERDTNSRERLALAAELAEALEHGGIEVHFQPKADAISRRIKGVEALVRWRRADGRLVSPIEFLAVAEQVGLSRPLTRKVLAISLDQLRTWRNAGHDLHLAVNTTVADLIDERFPREVAQALAAHGLPVDALILEVTETSILSDPVRIGNVLAQLDKLGIGLSLDDFGTGYSTLTHLKSLPVGEVKIDRSFVARMCADTTDAAIVHAMIQLAHKLGIRVVAEGVEDDETWEALSAVGCELIQGYALSRPLPAAELEQALNAKPAEATPSTSNSTPSRTADMRAATRPKPIAT
ncbi:MAG: putative bifunctional diguanylate cyclase/phosphodiesterase [Solirubrobacteraceae bacterium]